MRIAYAGSPDAAVPPLRALASLIPRRRRRGHPARQGARALAAAPARPRSAQAAEELGIPALRPATINAPEVVEELSAAGAEALVVVAFGQILRDVVLSRWPCVNVHFSLLPAYRGAAPVERAIMDGVAETGVTTMFMEAGLDTGPVLAVERTPVGEDEEGGALLARLSELGGPLLVRTIDDLEAGRLDPRPQPEEGVSLRPEDPPGGPCARPDATPPPRSRAACARWPPTSARPAASTASRSRSGARGSCRSRCRPACRSPRGACSPHTGAGSLEITELQPPGRGRMDAAAFLRGWRGPLVWGGE